MQKRNYEAEITELFKSKHASKLVLLECGPFAWNARPSVQCLECTREWTPRIDSLIAGSGCKRCAGKINFESYKRTKQYKRNMLERSASNLKSQSEYKDQIRQVHGGAVVVLGTYAGVRTLLEHYCVEHEAKFIQLPEIVLLGARCKECTRNRRSKAKLKPFNMRRENDVDYVNFRAEVARITNTIYRQYYYQLNPNAATRSYRAYHLDHIYSVAETFSNHKRLKYPATITELCHPANLRLLDRVANQRKQSACGISLTKLRKNIVSWNRQYGNPFKVYRGAVEVQPRANYV